MKTNAEIGGDDANVVPGEILLSAAGVRFRKKVRLNWLEIWTIACSARPNRTTCIIYIVLASLVSISCYAVQWRLSKKVNEMPEQLQVHTVVSMPFEENSYIVWLSGRDDAIVIDPGLEPGLILDFVHEQRLTIAAILNTHGHADHIGGNEALKESWPQAPLIIGAKDAHMLRDAEANLSAPFGLPITSPPADRVVREGDIIEAAALRFEVFDVPGHSPGHVVYAYRDSPCQVFGGDVLFRGSIGRYDFPGSDGRLLIEGIRSKMFAFPGNTVVFPGHGPVTTIGHERRTNPFVGDDVSA